MLGRAGKQAVQDALETVEAEVLARRPLGSLSGGERQRLLDEPLISLDPRYQQAVVELVRRVQQQRQLTVLMSAHELNPLLGTMNRVLYLGGGQAALGTVAEVITSPVLSALYGTPIEVIHHGGRIFVVNGLTNSAKEAGHDVHHHDALV